MKKTILLYLSATLLLGSCGVYKKYEEKTVADVPQHLYGSLGTVHGDTVAMPSEGVSVQDDTLATHSLADIPWQQFFTDPVLQGLIAQALASNVDVLTAQLHVDEANAGLKAARLGYLPSFAFAPSGVLSSYDGGKATKVYELPIVASWQLPLFGNQVTNQHRLAREQAQLAEDVSQNVRCQIVAATANLYYTLAMLQQQLRISRDMEQSWQQSVRTMQALVGAGQGTRAAVSQMEAARKGVQIGIVELERQQHDVRNALALLLAQPADSQEGLQASLDGFAFPATLCTGLPMQLLHQRPDVRMAERQLAAAHYNVQLARGQMYPNVTLSGSAGFTNSVGNMIIDPAKLLLSAVASLTQPIFAKGQLSANLKVQKAEQEAARLAFANALLKAGIEVNDALAACNEAQRKQELYEEQTAQLEQALRSTTLLMEHGPVNYLEVLTARQSLQQARLAQTANQMQAVQSVISLYTALGGGETVD